MKNPIKDVLWVRMSKGTVGCLTQVFSTKMNAAIPARPRMRGARTCTESHEYAPPAQVSPRMVEVDPATKMTFLRRYLGQASRAARRGMDVRVVHLRKLLLPCCLWSLDAKEAADEEHCNGCNWKVHWAKGVSESYSSEARGATHCRTTNATGRRWQTHRRSEDR